MPGRFRKHHDSEHDEGAQRLARALGWFSIGLGLAQTIAPRHVARLVGVEDGSKATSVMRGVGAREIATGVGLLTGQRPAGFLWGRVAGDSMDLALLEAARRSNGERDGRARAAMAAVAGIALLDAYAAQRVSRSGAVTSRHVKTAITIRRPREEVYRFWRHFENLPLFMAHIASVEVHDERRSHWRVEAPGGMQVEWDAEIIDDKEGEHISWRSLGGADIDNAGSVYFVDAPGDRGTEVYVDIRYYPPAGRLGVVVAKLFGREPGQQAEGDLRRLKQVLETGHVVRSDATLERGMHPAQPPFELPAPSPGRGEELR